MIWNMAASAFKSVRLTERTYLRVNADFLNNVFNMPGTQTPGGDGVILNRTSANSPRVLLYLLLAAALLQPPGQRAAALVDAGIDLSHGGRFNEAADKFVRALALDPNLAEAHYLLGLIRQQEGRTDAALQSFRAALKK